MTIHRLPVREAELFKALGHPIRLQILTVLAQKEACVCNLEARLKIRQAYLSQQLAVLREAGLVAERRMGTYVHCRARRPQVVEMINAMRAFTGSADLGLPQPNAAASPYLDASPHAHSAPHAHASGHPHELSHGHLHTSIDAHLLARARGRGHDDHQLFLRLVLLNP